MVREKKKGLPEDNKSFSGPENYLIRLCEKRDLFFNVVLPRCDCILKEE